MKKVNESFMHGALNSTAKYCNYVWYEVGMAESVGICEAISYLLSLFRQQTSYLYFLVI